MWGEVMLHAHLREPLPEGMGFDEQGRRIARRGSGAQGRRRAVRRPQGLRPVVCDPGAGHARRRRARQGQVRDYGFLFWAVDPNAMLPGGEFKSQMSEFVRQVKATPRQPGVEEIRIPSERALRERERRRREGIVLERKVVESLQAL